VPVIIVIVAFSENFVIFFVRPIRIVEAMRGVEMLFSENGYFHVLRD
jgi:hypothetical protein